MLPEKCQKAISYHPYHRLQSGRSAEPKNGCTHHSTNQHCRLLRGKSEYGHSFTLLRSLRCAFSDALRTKLSPRARNLVKLRIVRRREPDDRGTMNQTCLPQSKRSPFADRCVAPLGITAAICTHNGAARLPATLRRLGLQSVPTEIPWEVVLIDNASTDGTADVARACWPAAVRPQLRVVSEDRLGLSYTPGSCVCR